MFDDVRDSSTDVVERSHTAAKEAGADYFLAVGSGCGHRHGEGRRCRVHARREHHDQEGFLLMPRDNDGMGEPLRSLRSRACQPRRQQERGR